MCREHGGGERCTYPECKNSARHGGLPGLCITHGGGRRCESEACAVFDAPQRGFATVRTEDGRAYCVECYARLMGWRRDARVMVRKEHLVIAALLHRFELHNAGLDEDVQLPYPDVHDCAACAGRPRPDLAWVVGEHAVICENDELGLKHEDKDERLATIMVDLGCTSISAVRFNPDATADKSRPPSIRRKRLRTGEARFEAVPHEFDERIDTLFEWIKDRLECAREGKDLADEWKVKLFF